MDLHKEMVPALMNCWFCLKLVKMFQILVNLIQGMMTRSASLGDFSGIDSGTIAGYTGHIPNSRDAFGNSYSKFLLRDQGFTLPSANNEQLARDFSSKPIIKGRIASDKNESRL